MDGNELRAMQAPIKQRYKNDPQAGVVTLKASGTLDDSNIACKVETGRALAVAGLHPATGGSGRRTVLRRHAAGALVACAGVTLKAVATALDIPLRRAPCRRKAISISAGRSGVAKDAPVGFAQIRLRFDVDTDAAQEQARPVAQAHRALLRGVSDHQERAAGRGEVGAGLALFTSPVYGRGRPRPSRIRL